MKLSTKLILLSIATILIPMLIIVSFSTFMIYQSRAISQWEFLENIYSNIENEIISTEKNYLKNIKIAADNDMVRDKFHLYEKYWSQLSESLIAYDLQSLNEYIEEIARDNEIEVVSAYRRYQDTFSLVAGYGSSQYLPIVLFKNIVQRKYNRAGYKRYPDGIYLVIVSPVFSDGRLVGLLQFVRSYDNEFFQRYASLYNIDYAMISKNALIFNSKESTNKAVRELLTEPNDDKRRTFRSGSSTYSVLAVPFDLGGDASGDIILYAERANLFGGESFLIQRLLALTLLCVMIPVVTFFIKEIRLIKVINSLLAATDSISSGNYNSKVDVRSRDELGQLSRNFNQMVSVLKKNRTELEIQNNELAMKNSYIDAVFQSLRINIIVLDPERKIQVVSKNASSRLELSQEQFGRDLLTIEPFAGEEALLGKTLDEVLRKKTFTRLYSIKFDSTSYEMDFYPVVEDDHSISAVVLILNNITDRMNMERALIQSDRLASVGTLAAGLAHEINNPMSIILNHVQLLQSDKLTPDEQTRFMGRVESEIKRVSKLINNLLKFSREETLIPEHIDLAEIFNEVIGLFDPKVKTEPVDKIYDGYNMIVEDADLFKIKFKEKQIDFYLSAKLKDEELVCGRDSLKQILFNLIKNAFESCEEHDGIISARIERLPEGYRITLTDNGCGISDEELINVFELFYTQGKPGTGVGLGLPLCRRLMNNMGGEIGITSQKDYGTTVTLLFPDREVFYG